MKFRSLIIKNIFRNKSRSILAVIGIAIGVAAVIGLGSITDDLSQSAQSALTADAADFSVINNTNSGNGTNGGGGGFVDQLINQSTVEQIQQITGVGSAVGVLRSSVNLNNNTTSNITNSGIGGGFRSMTNIIGIDSGYLSMDDIVITNGTTYSGTNQVIIGQS
jgi:putative ABC transport system permease protein